VTLALLLSHQRRRALAIGQTVTAVSRQLHAAISESLAGMKIVRATGAAEKQSELLRRASTAQQNAAIQLTLAHGAARAWFDVGNVVALSIIAFVALRHMAMPPSELFALLFVFMRLAPQASGVHQSYQQLRSELPAFQDVSNALDRFTVDAEPVEGSEQLVTFERECRLDRVSFSYGDTPTVTDVSITITRGCTVAVVGASGAGKTTLADLALGLLTPASGAIVVDDMRLSEHSLANWRAQIGYVPQDAFLFHDTIRANLLWAAPAAGEDELWRALWSASAGFVAGLPNGLDTIVGDRGILLSGGERQRIALARTLLRAPNLLILDEPTSALDAQNARAVHDAIAALHGSVAILLITHRLASVRDADLIYVLDHGRVVESGTWAELVGTSAGRFSELCRAQGVDLDTRAVDQSLPGGVPHRAAPVA
jgi:ATP-binding cassette subfamily C protein